ncbi:hypothetical protein [Kangiella sp. M94]
MKNRVFILFGMFLICGCSSEQVKHKVLCENEAGLKIYNKAQANGYFDRTCNSLDHCSMKLFESGLPFVVFEFKRSKHGYDFENGIYNMRFKEELCEYSRKGIVKKIKEMKIDECLDIQVASEPFPRYELNREYKSNYKLSSSNWSLSKSSFIVVDREKKEILAEDVQLRLSKKSAWSSIFFKSSYSCPDSSPIKERSYLIKKVIFKEEGDDE